MSNPDEFKILLATDIHLGYQHKHEVGLCRLRKVGLCRSRMAIHNWISSFTSVIV